MILTDTSVPEHKSDFAAPKQPLSLSNYFPAGTHYFYAYPAGEASGFLNKVSPRAEELVAARTLSCAGSNIIAVKFAATHNSVLGEDIINALAIPQLPPHQLVVLPQEIDASLAGEARNSAIKAELEYRITPGNLIMAQPYTDTHLADLFQIPTHLSSWINDKNNMKQYIDEKFMPKKQGIYLNGQQLAEHAQEIKLPCVVKVSSSSSGDGVYLCRSKRDLSLAMQELRKVTSTIFVEQLIEATHNYGIHFGIPFDKKLPIDLIGINQQLTTPDGEFVGGIIDSLSLPKPLRPLERYLLDDVLPKVRAMGWYGIGCFDVLCDEQDNFYLIDCNFRITGMSAYHFLISKSVLQTPILSFSGEFVGSRHMLEQNLFPYAHKDSSNKWVQIIALTHYDGLWSFNGSLLFSNNDELEKRAHTLLQLGIKSQALSYIV